RITACGCRDWRLRRVAAIRTAPPACRRSRSTSPHDPGSAPARSRSAPGQHARSCLADRLAPDRDRAAHAARALVADRSHAVPVRLALLLHAQPRAFAFALAGD